MCVRVSVSECLLRLGLGLSLCLRGSVTVVHKGVSVFVSRPESVSVYDRKIVCVCV